MASLVRAIGRDEFFVAAGTSAAQDFRDWFWESASGLVGSGARITTEFLARLAAVVQVDSRVVTTLGQLRMRFFQGRGAGVVAAAVGGERLAGFSARAETSAARLRVQAANHSRARRHSIASLFGVEPAPYDPCPCRGAEKYKFCCGAVPSR